MKTGTFIILIFLCCSACAQQTIFVRVYNLRGEKITKGNVSVVTDSSLQLKGKKAPINIPISKIGFLKTKRSAGNDVLKGSVIGVSLFAIFFASISTNPDQYLAFTPSQGAVGGAIIGLPLGAAMGGLSILLKNSKRYAIEGNFVKWKVFQSDVEKNGRH